MLLLFLPLFVSFAQSTDNNSFFVFSQVNHMPMFIRMSNNGRVTVSTTTTIFTCMTLWPCNVHIHSQHKLLSCLLIYSQQKANLMQPQQPHIKVWSPIQKIIQEILFVVSSSPMLCSQSSKMEPPGWLTSHPHHHWHLYLYIYIYTDIIFLFLYCLLHLFLPIHMYTSFGLLYLAATQSGWDIKQSNNKQANKATNKIQHITTHHIGHGVLWWAWGVSYTIYIQSL